MIRRFHCFIIFLTLGLGECRLSKAVDESRFEQALIYPSRIKDQVYRDEVHLHWLPDDRSCWYRIQTGPKAFEYVLVDARTGERKVASTLERLGLPRKVPMRSSELEIFNRKKTTKTGTATTIRLSNEMPESISIYWIDQQGKQRSYGSLESNEERELNTFEGHVWLIKSEAKEKLAILEAQATDQTIIIDGEGKPAKANRQRKDSRVSPDGKWKVHFKEPDDYQPRRVTIVNSSPNEQLQPELIEFSYNKPGDPLPQTKLSVVSNSDEYANPIFIDDKLFPTPFELSENADVEWAADSSEFYFDYNQRGHQLYRVLAVSTANGAANGIVRVLAEETSDTFIDYQKKNWKHWLHATNEWIWMSERDGWNHLWLHDTPEGKVKNPITSGEWVVREVLHVDPENRKVWFMACGLVATEDPYHKHLCRVNFDGSDFIKLTHDDGNHRVEFSPDRECFIDRCSRADVPTRHRLCRSIDGSLIAELETADIASLLNTGWKIPERFVAKGRDGITDIYGVIIKPSDFDPTRSYPIVEEVYAGPHSAFVPKDFSTFPRHHQVAELGCIVVQIDGMGTNHRGKSFHNLCWKNLKDAGFPDRIAWIKAAAATRPWMNLERVGIYGGSAGGQSAMRALLDHHDFYDVAVADCGCHDNRMDKIWWNEQWMGWPVDESYAANSNVEDAQKLQGHLLLIVGELDQNVDPASTTQVVHALQKAGKSFDYMPIIGAGHGAAETPYGSRLRLRYLTEHLLDDDLKIR